MGFFTTERFVAEVEEVAAPSPVERRPASRAESAARIEAALRRAPVLPDADDAVDEVADSRAADDAMGEVAGPRADDATEARIAKAEERAADAQSRAADAEVRAADAQRRAAEPRATRPAPGDPLVDPAVGPAPAAAPRTTDWRSAVATAAGINVLAGIWLIIAPFVLGYGNGDPYWNDIIFGAIVGLIGIVRTAGAYRESWLSWVNALIGVWIFASAFWLDNTGQAAINDVILGAIVFVLGLVAATASEEGAAAAPPPEGTGTPRW
jgi:hypothetical protein